MAVSLMSKDESSIDSPTTARDMISILDLRLKNQGYVYNANDFDAVLNFYDGNEKYLTTNIKKQLLFLITHPKWIQRLKADFNYMWLFSDDEFEKESSTDFHEGQLAEVDEILFEDVIGAIPFGIDIKDNDVLRAKSVSRISSIFDYDTLNSSVEFDLLRKAKEGDQNARNELILRNTRLVAWTFSRYFNWIKGELREEMIQEGILGLVEAIERYDIAFNTKLGTIAVPYIRNYMQHHYALFQRIVPYRISRVLDISNFWKTYEKMKDKNFGFPPTLAEMVTATGLSEKIIRKLIVYSAKESSLDTAINEDENGGYTMKDIIADANTMAPELAIAREEEYKDLLHKLSILHEDDYAIIAEYFGISGHENDGTTLDVVGKPRGISRERVRQKIEATLTALRNIDDALMLINLIYNRAYLAYFQKKFPGRNIKEEFPGFDYSHIKVNSSQSGMFLYIYKIHEFPTSVFSVITSDEFLQILSELPQVSKNTTYQRRKLFYIQLPSGFVTKVYPPTLIMEHAGIPDGHDVSLTSGIVQSRFEDIMGSDLTLEMKDMLLTNKIQKGIGGNAIHRKKNGSFRKG